MGRRRRLGSLEKIAGDADRAPWMLKRSERSLNLTMKCWETLLPHVVRHPSLKLDLMPWLVAYQKQYPGAMYSGCGGGYLIVVSEKPVPGAFQVNVRTASK